VSAEIRTATPRSTPRPTTRRRPPHSQRNTSTSNVRFIRSAHRSRLLSLQIDRARALFTELRLIGGSD